jgi:hypothetical protein
MRTSDPGIDLSERELRASLGTSYANDRLLRGKSSIVVTVA